MFSSIQASFRKRDRGFRPRTGGVYEQFVERTLAEYRIPAWLTYIYIAIKNPLKPPHAAAEAYIPSPLRQGLLKVGHLVSVLILAKSKTRGEGLAGTQLTSGTTSVGCSIIKVLNLPHCCESQCDSGHSEDDVGDDFGRHRVWVRVSPSSQGLVNNLRIM
jgi:hypothetical protein